MERRIDLEEVSGGRLYGADDMVRADCGGCQGCSVCCAGMGKSIILDPMDIYRLTANLGLSFEALMADKLELNLVDGMILPNLKMTGQEEKCSFLDSGGRCKIHAFRPGFCRLFPLGRLYERRSFQYFLQVHECAKKDRAKIKVRKWIDMPDFSSYEKFIADWHYLLKDMGQGVKMAGDMAVVKAVNMYILNHFYVTPYDGQEEFYPQFYKRLEKALDFAREQGVIVGGRG